jgi:hypothetical protein
MADTEKIYDASTDDPEKVVELGRNATYGKESLEHAKVGRGDWQIIGASQSRASGR